jgi:hypothetical protein
MGKLPVTQQTRMILVTFCLCLGSILACEVIDPLISFEENLFLTFSDGFSYLTHLDEHDDDFVLIAQTSNRNRAAIIDQDKSSHIPGSACSLSPLLPPPKAS